MLGVWFLILFLLVVGIVFIAYTRLSGGVKQNVGLGYWVDSHVVVREDARHRISLSYIDLAEGKTREIADAIKTRVHLSNTGTRLILGAEVQNGPIKFDFPGSRLLGDESSIIPNSPDNKRIVPDAGFSGGSLTIEFHHLEAGEWVEVDFLHETNSGQPRHPPAGIVPGMASGEIQMLPFGQRGAGGSTDTGSLPSGAFQSLFVALVVAVLLLFFFLGIARGCAPSTPVVELGPSTPAGHLQQYVMTFHGPMEPAIALEAGEQARRQPEPFVARIFKLQERGDVLPVELNLPVGWYVVFYREVTTNRSGRNRCSEVLEIVEPDTTYDLHFFSGPDPCGGTVDLVIRG